MVDSDEQRRIEDNLTVIRFYIKNHFPHYTIKESSVPSLYYKFVVTLSFLREAPNDKLHKRHRLRVEWARLSDHRNTPENIRSALESGNVASGMIQAGDNDYYW